MDFNNRLSLIILALAVFVLAACSTSPTGTPGVVTAIVTLEPTPSRPPDAIPATATPSQVPQPASPIPVKPEDLQGVRVQLWHAWDGGLGRQFNDLIAAFNAGNSYGIQVESIYQGTYDDLSASVVAALDAGQAPDLAVGYPFQALAWDDPGEVVDLKSYLEDPIWGYTPEEQADFYAAFWEGDLVDGRRVGMPAQRFGQVLLYNHTWGQELGFGTPPSAPVQFRRQACTAAESMRQDEDVTNDATGGYIVSTHYDAMLSWIFSFGGQVISPDGSYRFDTPAAEQAFTYLKELFDQGCAWQTDEAQAANEFAGRRGLFMVDSIANLPEVRRAFQRSGNADQWGAIPFPTQEEAHIAVYGPSYILFSGTADEQLASWIVVRWLLEPQNQARLAEASSSFPLRRSTLDRLQGYAAANPAWTQAVELLTAARPEPAAQSWENVRWAVHDATTQLFRYYFELENVPELVELLDDTADEIEGQY